jgi:hypothetical protein
VAFKFPHYVEFRTGLGLDGQRWGDNMTVTLRGGELVPTGLLRVAGCSPEGKTGLKWEKEIKGWKNEESAKT